MTTLGNDQSARAFSRFDYNQNVLSSENPPDGKNFFFDSNYALPEPETPQNRNLLYGFSGNSNNFYCNTAKGDQFIVLLDQKKSSSPIKFESLSSMDFPIVSYFLAQNGGETPYHKWYAAEDSQHAANASVGRFEEYTQAKTPPRLWRRGTRMLWNDETSEYNATQSSYQASSGRLAQPLIQNSNLRGGLFYAPSPLGAGFQPRGSWELPFMDSHIYFRQPTDPTEYKNFFPPTPLGKPSSGLPSVVTLYDVPRQSIGIASLGQFQHAPFSLQPWHPSYILGNSFSTYQADKDATVLRDQENEFKVTDINRLQNFSSRFMSGNGYKDGNAFQRGESDSTTTHNNEILHFDISYELNHAIWDEYMISGVNSNSSGSLNWSAAEELPISSYQIFKPTELTDSGLASKMQTPDWLYFHASEVIRNTNAFNVNGDNKNVWKAFLLSLKGKKSYSIQTPTGNEDDDLTVLSRAFLPGEEASKNGTTSQDEKAYNTFRALTDDNIDALAEAIVEEVRDRGPFVSLSDFINRKLDEKSSSGGTVDNFQMGTLDAAIDASGINASLQSAGGPFDSDTSQKIATNIKSFNQTPDFRTTNLPGYFSQLDLLTPMAPHLTTRGDTFTIRAYGESRDSSGRVAAKAYCQAVVQRLPDYIDSTDSPVEPALIEDPLNPGELKVNVTGSGESGLSDINIRLGRKFVIRSFTWLPESEFKTN